MVDPRLPFATRTTSLSASKVYASKFISTYQILRHPDKSCCRDKVNRVASRRAGALFFARHLDYFIVTLNFIVIYRDLVPSRSFTVTLGSLPSTGTGKNQATATQTATNQTAGPLGGIASVKPEIVYFREFIMTLNFRPSTGTQPSGQFLHDKPACHPDTEIGLS